MPSILLYSFNGCHRNTWLLLRTLSVLPLSILELSRKKKKQSKTFQLLKASIFLYRWLIKKKPAFYFWVKCLCSEKLYVSAKMITFAPRFNKSMLYKKRYLVLQKILLVTQHFERVFHLYMYWHWLESHACIGRIIV